MRRITLTFVPVLAVKTAMAAGPVDLSNVPITATPTVVGSQSVVSGGVTNIPIELSVTTFSPSWGSEINIDITGPDGFLLTLDGSDSDILGDDGPDDLTFGWGDSSGTFTFIGTVAVAGGVGTYTVSVFDSNDDFSGESNAVFNSGSNIVIYPTPGTAGLLLVGATGLMRRRR